VVAVIAQKPGPVRRYVEETGLPFHILIDETREVTKRYGIWYRFGLTGVNIAKPALFLIDTGRIIRAVFVGERQDDFPGDADITRALDHFDADRNPLRS
jgi:peroxiredoxin